MAGTWEYIEDDYVFGASPRASHLGRGGERRPSTCQDSHLAGKRGASQGSPLRVAPGAPIGYGSGPRASTDGVAFNNYIHLGRFAAGRDEKLMNVNNVKVFDEERTWVNRFTCEIVFQPDTDAP